MNEKNNEGFIAQLREVIKDGIDYLASVVALVQMRITINVLAAAAYLLLLFFALIVGLGSFVFLNIALGLWLANILQSGVSALLVLGGFYGVVFLIAAGILAHRINRMTS